MFSKILIAELKSDRSTSLAHIPKRVSMLSQRYRFVQCITHSCITRNFGELTYLSHVVAGKITVPSLESLSQKVEEFKHRPKDNFIKLV